MSEHKIKDKRYWECMAEIIGVLKKYDMAGAVTVISQERAAFKYHFPTWGCISMTETELRFKAKKADYPNEEAWLRTVELSTHIILQMRDIAVNTFSMCESIESDLRQKFAIEHKPFHDFDPERSH